MQLAIESDSRLSSGVRDPGRLKAGLSRVAGLVRRHWVLSALLVLGLALRVVTMIAYQPAILYIDSVASYLLPLPKLSVTGQDPIGYDILLLKPLLAVGNLATVAAFQHLLGLGIAITGYVLLLHKGAWRWVAALAVAPVLLDAYQLQIEHMIMSDPLFEALLMAALTVLVWPRRPDWRHALIAGLLLGISVPVRQAGEPLFIPAVLYVLLAGIVVVCFALPVAGYATLYHHSTGKFGLSRIGGDTLYGRVATFADCTGLSLPADERILCPTMPPDERPGADYWAHDPRSLFFVMEKQVGTNAEANRLADDFSKRIIKHQPLDFAKAVGADAVKVFQWNRLHQDPADPPVDRWQFQVGMPLFLPLVSNSEISMLDHKYGDGNPVTVTPLTKFLRAYQLHGGSTPGPVVALAILLALAPLVRWRRSGPARLPALLFLLSGAAVLLFGDVVLFSWRYQLPGYVLIPVAGVLGLTAAFGRGTSAVSSNPGSSSRDSSGPGSSGPGSSGPDEQAPADGAATPAVDRE
ncbi:hypothetical protein GCM10023322_60520 [Rugosimonospora acidiphila]|uniref:ArnT-like N-terminal domain-containing protein n=1 Tax=Rugosimonospora acidiphila TaxID=556531 RepID=A0ABP9SFS3_9ACTN